MLNNSLVVTSNTYWSIQMTQVWVCITMIRRNNRTKEGFGVNFATAKHPGSMKCCFHGYTVHFLEDKTRQERTQKGWASEEQNKKERRERQSNHKVEKDNLITKFLVKLHNYIMQSSQSHYKYEAFFVISQKIRAT